MVVEAVQLAGGILFGVVGAILLLVAFDLFRDGPSRIGVMRSIGQGLKAYAFGLLASEPGASGWRFNRGWHSEIAEDGTQIFRNGSRVSDDAV